MLKKFTSQEMKKVLRAILKLPEQDQIVYTKAIYRLREDLSADLRATKHKEADTLAKNFHNYICSLSVLEFTRAQKKNDKLAKELVDSGKIQEFIKRAISEAS